MGRMTILERKKYTVSLDVKFLLSNKQKDLRLNKNELERLRVPQLQKVNENVKEYECDYSYDNLSLFPYCIVYNLLYEISYQ